MIVHLGIRWIITDLDGTLLNSKQQISDKLMKRIQQYMRRGGHFSLATGRTLSGVLPIIRALNLASPLILYNGAKIYDPVEGRYLVEHALPSEAAEAALNIYKTVGKELGLDLLVFGGERVFSPEYSDAVVQHANKDQINIDHRPFEYFYAMPGGISKMMLIGPPDRIRLFQQEATALNTVQSEPTYLEILPPNVNKGTALLRLIELVGAEPDQFAAVGDNLNDLEMVGMLRHGVAVRNAHPRLKEAASWVTNRTNDEDALLEVIEYALGGRNLHGSSVFRDERR